MKKIYFLVLIAAVVGLTFSSCEKGDTTEVKPTFSVVANWKTTSVSREYFYKEQSIGIKYTMQLSDYVDHINLKADGTGEMTGNGVVVRKFNYTSTSADIHFSNVLSFDGKNWVGAPSFMFYINSLTNNQMMFNQQDFYFNRPMEQYKEYDKIIFNVTVVKD